MTATREQDDGGEPAVLVVDHTAPEDVPEGSEVHDRIVEQLLRPRGMALGDPNPLRNTLPSFEDGVDTVRYEAPSGVTPPFGVDDPRFVRYDGVVYRVTARRLA